MEEFTGGCRCGDIRFVARGRPYRVGICHCLDCRKHHGALFSAAAMFPDTAVTITGKTHAFAGRHFCPRCGSRRWSCGPGDRPRSRAKPADVIRRDGRMATIRRTVGGPP